MKTCSRCGQTKALNAFYARKAASDGLYSHCKQCHNVACRKWQSKNAVKFETDKRSYRKSCTENIAPNFIARCLRMSVKTITPELIELKTEQLSISRTTKQLIKEIQNGTK